MSEKPQLVALRGIVKEFPRVRANDRVDFDLRAGEIHALLGENGAGKTTLMNILSGLYRPDAGEIVIRGEPAELRSPRDAIARGIGMVHQHFRLVDRFTVAENVTLGWRTPRALIRRRPLEHEIARLSNEYRLHVDAGRPVWQLSVGEQQRVEILKNLYRGAEILILDEPTAVLTPQEASGLFDSLRDMAAAGRAVIFITHKLDEVIAVADRVTVLRRGVKVATVATSATTKRELARMMIGQDLPERGDEAPAEPGDVVLAIERLEADDDRGLTALKHVDLEVRAGEIVGVAGVAGNGQRELAEVLVGLRPARGGRILFDGNEITRWSIARRIAAGIGYCPEDRLRQGVAPSLSVTENLISKRYRTRPVGGRFLLRRREAKRAARELVQRFDIRGADLDSPVAALSGGNVQKLVLARELGAGPSLLIAAQPTRGLDVGAADFIRRLLVEQRTRGKAVLVIGEDLDELLEVCDRIAVIYEGTINGVFPAREADEERIGLLMAGRAA